LPFGCRQEKIITLLIMQTPDAPAEFIFRLWPWIEANKNRLIGGLVAIVVIAGIVFFIISEREQQEINAGNTLSEVMLDSVVGGNETQLSGQLEQLASKYAGTVAGQRARLQAAAALFAAGNYADAQAQFQQYLAAYPNGQFAATAQLGIGSSLDAQNKADEAASAYQQVIARFPGSSSIAPAEFALGGIAEKQNKLPEAISHFENAGRASAGGSLAQQAMMQAAALRAKVAAAAPKPSLQPEMQGLPKPAGAIPANAK
jgi:predicted negative regulator of RcsB-dependent stress response